MAYYGDPNKDQAAGKHYDLMSTADIAALRVRSITASSAALFLWATGPRLPEAIKVMAAWGFHYRGVALGLGQDGARRTHHPWPGRAADLLEADDRVPTRRVDLSPRSATAAPDGGAGAGRPRPAGRHSEKPSVFRDRIVELLGDVARIELFAREPVAGWDAWGNEVAEVDQAA